MDHHYRLVVLTLVLLGSVHGRRTKRIILGRILLDRQLYTASDYYVWIRDLHHCGYVYGHSFYNTREKLHTEEKLDVFPDIAFPLPHLPHQNFWRADDESKDTYLGTINAQPQTAGYNIEPKFLKCGGVLLTPTIVQTACHCLSVFETRENDLFSNAKEEKTWEQMYLVYPGFSDVTTMTVGMISSRYYVHSKCSQLNWESVTGQRGKISIRFILHNYGLITLRSSVEDDARISNRFNYAPIYTQYDIELLWRNTESKEYTCLFFGFGPYSRIASAGKTVLIDNPATYMRFGWRTIMNYYECHDFTYPYYIRGNFPFDYRENATWSCAFTQSRETDTFLAQGGDSGGPVVCNGEYYGVIGEPSDISANPAISVVSPIAFTVFENTKTFRGKFMKFIEKVNQDDYPPEPIRPTLK